MKSEPGAALLVPIAAEHFERVADFLHTQMNNRISAVQWRKTVATNWFADSPNHGFMLYSESQGVVGVLCAIYSQVLIDGQLRRMCNPHTWCVLEGFRKRSIELVVAVIKQPDWHFSMLSPNQEGEQIFAFLKFKPADRAIRIFPCGLWLKPFARGRIIVADSELESALDGSALQVYKDHREFNWLHFLAVSTGDRRCLIIYRKRKFKRLGAAAVLYISDPGMFAESLGAVCNYLQWHAQVWSVLVEQRLLGAWSPRRSLVGPQGHPKFLLSSELAADAVPNIYSELVALNG